MKLRLPVIVVAVAVLLSSVAWGQTRDGRPAMELKELTVAKLIQQLDSRSFRVREQASAELARRGKPALPALTRLLGNPAASIEARRRAQAVVVRIKISFRTTLRATQITDAGWMMVEIEGTTPWWVPLRGLTKLEKLDLSRCDQITDAGLVHLKGLTNLEKLDLSYCYQLTDAGLAHLKGLTNLEKLDLSWCDITDAGLAHL